MEGETHAVKGRKVCKEKRQESERMSESPWSKAWTLVSLFSATLADAFVEEAENQNFHYFKKKELWREYKYQEINIFS